MTRAAIAALAPVLDGSAPVRGPTRLAQAFLLEAIARDALGDPAAAGPAVERALDLRDVPAPVTAPADGAARQQSSAGNAGVLPGGFPRSCRARHGFVCRSASAATALPLAAQAGNHIVDVTPAHHVRSQPGPAATTSRQETGAPGGPPGHKQKEKTHDRVLDVPGGRIAYDVTGSGPLVVLSHGIGVRRRDYRFLAPMLAQAGYRVANADLRGHGESSMGWASITRTDVAGDLAALIGHLGGPAVIVGHSISGGAATVAAATRPDLVAGNVEINPFTRTVHYSLAQARVPVPAAAPVGRQQAKDHLVGEFPANPRRVAEPALGHEPGPLGGPDHRRVAGQGIDLQPVQAADGEAVLT